ncbi:hypothetical protein OHV05_37645 (plasmid) [Kitasatospora sp. NBC_00070]|uniref:hypothetical protein n=1 Tax=Kitasatospora sp. NBC_00070 TaxID=2975962 RepID=UPI002F91A37A
MTIPGQLSLGGLVLAVAVLVFTGVRWWRTGRQLPGAAAVTGGLAVGLLSALCSGGLAGFAARRVTTEVTNPLGNKVSGAGMEQLLPQAGPAGMTAEGGVTTAVLVLAAVLAWQCCDAQLRRQLAAGAFAGSGLGLAGGISGLAAVTLIPAANTAGGLLLAFLS